MVSAVDWIIPQFHGAFVTIPALSDSDHETLKRRVPGVVVLQKNKDAWKLKVSNHAVMPLSAALKEFQIPIYEASGTMAPPAPVPYETVLETLRAGGELKDEFMNFATDYQKEAICFAAPRIGTMLKHPTGSGKTFTAIVWSLLAPGAILVVTRAPTRNQYARQFIRFTHLRPFVCETKYRKKDQWKSLDEYRGWCEQQGQRPVVVVSWDALSDWIDRLGTYSWSTAIFDESQKGKSGKRWTVIPMPLRSAPGYAEAVASVKQRGGFVKLSRDQSGIEGEVEEVGILPTDNISSDVGKVTKWMTRRVTSTATPIYNLVRDIWSQLDMLEPFAWGGYRDFTFRYCDAKKGEYGGIDDKGMSNAEELAIRLQYVFHVVSGAVARAGLPPKRREPWFIPPSEQVEPTGGWKNVIKAAKKSGKGADLEVRLMMAASAKRQAILNRISEHLESNHKIVVFTGRRRDCEELYDLIKGLKGKGAAKDVWFAHGEHSQDEREEILQKYIEHLGGCVLVGTGASWGTGIDGMQCTDAAIFAMLPYTPGELDQWEGRFTRTGQDRPVVIYFPIAEGTADEHVATILLDKLPAVDALAPIDTLEGAAQALSGHEDDPEVFAARILACISDEDVF